MKKLTQFLTPLCRGRVSAWKFQLWARNLNSASSAFRDRRNALFDEEAERQRRSRRSRVEKVRVTLENGPYNAELIMNRGQSTPYDCAKHLEEYLVERSVLALLDGKPWDMHRPLDFGGGLELRHFHEEEPSICNLTFWRSCSFVLGMLLENSFKDELSSRVRLCSFPPPNPSTGSFVYDVDLGKELGDWSPTNEELKCLSAQAGRLHWEDARFERLEVSESVAADIFANDPFKVSQIPAIAEKSRRMASSRAEGAVKPEAPYDNMAGSVGTVTLYRLKDHIDISLGPMIASTRFFQPGRFNLTSIHLIDSPSYGRLHRVQGVAIPFGVSLHPFTYDKILVKNAARLNPAPFPMIAD